MYQGFSHFSGFLHHFVLAKLASSSIRVNVMIYKSWDLLFFGQLTINPWLSAGQIISLPKIMFILLITFQTIHVWRYPF